MIGATHCIPYDEDCTICNPSDDNILRAAIEASGLSARRFAVKVMGRNERSVRRWLAGEPMPAVVSGWLRSYVRKAS